MMNLNGTTGMWTRGLLAGVCMAGMALSGCKSSTEKAADKNLDDMKSANKDVATTSVGKSDLPAECDAYVTKVDACVAKMGANNPMGGSFKQAMATARSSWANMPDKTQLASTCKQMASMIDQNPACK